MDALPYLREISLKRDQVESFDHYPFSIPAVRELDSLALSPEVTFFVGENGSGKSTLMEGIAVALGFNAEGGTKNFNFGTRASHSSLHAYLRTVKSYLKPRDGFFLRAESYFNLATNIEELDSVQSPYTLPPKIMESYGGVSLHEQSHGESFLALMLHRFGGQGLYLLDEPEAALSPTRQLAVLSRIRQLVQDSSQFIIATHSPILLAYPGALIYHIDGSGISPVRYEDTEHYEVTKAFLDNPARMLEELFRD
ncbi:MAG: AAA family ATPase [Natronospirillum sp.]